MLMIFVIGNSLLYSAVVRLVCMVHVAMKQINAIVNNLLYILLVIGVGGWSIVVWY